MSANNILVRIQSPEHGTKRVQTKPTERLTEFLAKVSKEFSLPTGTFRLYLDRGKSKELASGRTKTLNSYKVRHGDMLYLTNESSDVEMVDSSDMAMAGSSSRSGSITSIGTQNGIRKPSLIVIEDPVDQELNKMDGRIQRGRNEQLCHHGPSGKCFHCVPIEPYDEQYLNEADPPIKFLSFHSYLRKLTSGVDKGKFAQLENISVKIKAGCTSHPPWPEGICTKCQPNAVTLNRQRYRHVDYVQFENPFIVEQFLNYWRSTGNQRIGMMYGRYEHHEKVPLGIRASVAAIYEPPQLSQRNSVELLEDEKESIVSGIASKLGLQCVGWIFTDLVAEDLSKGSVKHFRGTINAHFLSAEECIMAAMLQNKYPNPCKLSPEGHFGSKFVTVVVTGDDNNQIHFEGYQVSNQCMALVNDDCFIPTLDAPELGYIKESSNKQYVPDVFYKEKDKYGNEVTRLARPLPVEYLLVDLQAAFPVEPAFTFHAGNGVKPFPLDNRDSMGELQDFNAFSAYLSQFTHEDFLKAMSDFHLLIFMATCDMLPLKGPVCKSSLVQITAWCLFGAKPLPEPIMTKISDAIFHHKSTETLPTLIEAIKNKDEGLARNWSKSEEWGTVEQLMQANAPSPSVSRQTSYVGPTANPLPPIGSTGGIWTCKHCTYHNSPDQMSCEMCNLPKA